MKYGIKIGDLFLSHTYQNDSYYSCATDLEFAMKSDDKERMESLAGKIGGKLIEIYSDYRYVDPIVGYLDTVPEGSIGGSIKDTIGYIRTYFLEHQDELCTCTVDSVQVEGPCDCCIFIDEATRILKDGKTTWKRVSEDSDRMITELLLDEMED